MFYRLYQSSADKNVCCLGDKARAGSKWLNRVGNVWALHVGLKFNAFSFFHKIYFIFSCKQIYIKSLLFFGEAITGRSQGHSQWSSGGHMGYWGLNSDMCPTHTLALSLKCILKYEIDDGNKTFKISNLKWSEKLLYLKYFSCCVVVGVWTSPYDADSLLLTWVHLWCWPSMVSHVLVKCYLCGPSAFFFMTWLSLKVS